MIDMWNTFIHPFDKPFFFQKIGNRPHDFENLRRRIPSSHDQPTVSQSGMRVQHIARTVRR